MFILRVLKNTYELFDATDVIRLAKSSVRNMAALGFATRMIDTNGARIEDAPVFVGSAFEPYADGTGPSVFLKPGIAFRYDTGEADEWLGEVEVILSDIVDTIALSTNAHGSGDDRIDVISLRPIEVEEDSQTRWFKSPTSGTPYQQTSPQRVRIDYEIVVTVGTVASSPVAPATPSGTYKVAEVLRPNGQVNVNPSDVTDARSLDRVRTGFLDAFSGVAARAGAVYFGDPSGNHYRFERDDESSPTRLRARDESGAKVDLEVGELIGADYVSTSSVFRFGSDAIGDAERLWIASDSSLNPEMLKSQKPDGTIVQFDSLLSPRAAARLRFTGGTWVVDYGWNVGAVTDNAVGDWDLELSPVFSNLEAICIISSANNPTGIHFTAIVDATNNVSIGAFNNAGTASDPADGVRVDLTVIGGHP